MFLARVLGNQDTGLNVATVSDDPGSKPRQSEKREGKLPSSFSQAIITQRRRKTRRRGEGRGKRK